MDPIPKPQVIQDRLDQIALEQRFLRSQLKLSRKAWAPRDEPLFDVIKDADGSVPTIDDPDETPDLMNLPVSPEAMPRLIGPGPNPPRTRRQVTPSEE